jgi:hypothetical protein
MVNHFQEKYGKQIIIFNSEDMSNTDIWLTKSNQYIAISFDNYPNTYIGFRISINQGQTERALTNLELKSPNTIRAIEEDIELAYFALAFSEEAYFYMHKSYTTDIQTLIETVKLELVGNINYSSIYLTEKKVDNSIMPGFIFAVKHKEDSTIYCYNSIDDITVTEDFSNVDSVMAEKLKDQLLGQ